jgi:hypothetical protein
MQKTGVAQCSDAFVRGSYANAPVMIAHVWITRAGGCCMTHILTFWLGFSAGVFSVIAVEAIIVCYGATR